MKTKLDTKVYTQVADRLRSARRILAVTHLNPDGDALGSLCFFTQMIRAIGLDCLPYCAGPLPVSLEFLPGFSEIITDKTLFSVKDFDVIVSLDCATAARTNLETEIANRSGDQIFIEIDHHPATAKTADLEIREAVAASTTEILWRLAQAASFIVTPGMAKSLLTGLVTDTAHFIHPTVSQITVSTAAALLGQGANLTRIADSLSQTKTITSLKLWGIALARLTLNSRYNIAFTVLTEKDFTATGAAKDDIEGISSFLSQLSHLKAVMLLFDEDNGFIRGSLRTVHDEVDVSSLARKLGGGGHRQAAGFIIPGRLVESKGRFSVKL